LSLGLNIFVSNFACLPVGRDLGLPLNKGNLKQKLPGGILKETAGQPKHEQPL